MYDDLVYNEQKNIYETKLILSNSNEKHIILDIGCGTGHHVNLFNQNNNIIIGIDNSPEMIKQAQKNYPKLEFRLANTLNSMEFNSETFTDITCLYFTIYYIKNKKLFLENCYKWLKPHGKLFLHLVNIYKFDPIIPTADPFVMISPQSYADKRITESTVNFDILDYKSNFKLDQDLDCTTTKLSKPNATFKETIKFKDKSKTRINEHNMYMCNQKSILSLARDIGFILKSQKEMVEIQYENQYIYTLEKPS